MTALSFVHCTASSNYHIPAVSVYMDYKKVIILPLLFFCSTALYIGCCQCMDHSRNFFGVTSVRVQAMGSDQSIVDTGVVTTVDTLYFNYSLMGECVAKTNTDLSFLVNSAAAWSCKCKNCGENGLKTKVSSVTISSDSIYNNVPANQPLNSFFMIEDTLPFDSLKGILNQSFTPYAFSLFTKTKPANNKGHVFKLSIRFVDGQTLFADTKRIFWM